MLSEHLDVPTLSYIFQFSYSLYVWFLLLDSLGKNKQKIFFNGKTNFYIRHLSLALG